jgi:hypothetical protein
VVSASQFTPVLIGKTKDTIFRMNLISADLKITCNEQRISFEWLLTYRNPLDKWIEGELTMPMMKNQIITGFDMNVGDVLRKGMIAEKMRAKSTYERIVARNNDPGLLEIVKGNSIKLRVFPILENENKRVRISYDCDFDYDAVNQIFKLDYPFDFIDNLEYFNIELDASNVNLPFFIESNINELEINQKGKSKLKLTDFKGSNYFKFIYRDKFEKPIVTLSKFDDEKYFSALVKSPLSNLESKKVNSITMFVDGSLSQKNNNFRAERYFLKEYLKKVGNAEIELIVFSLYEMARVKFKVESGNTDEIIEYLKSIEYIGATNYGSIDVSNIKSDIVIMLSNGVKNLGECDFMSIGKPIYFLNSNPDFNEAYCKNISEKSGGKFINLNNNDKLFNTVMSMFEMPISITNIKSSDEFSDIMISKHLEKPDIYRITGKFKSNDEKIRLIFSDGTETEIDFKDFKIQENNSVPRLWASDRVNSLILESKIDTAEIVRLSKKHSFATKFSSFIVLEAIEQYYYWQIDPPPDLEERFVVVSDSLKKIEEKWKIQYYYNYDSAQIAQNLYKLEVLKIKYYEKNKPIYDELKKEADKNFVNPYDFYRVLEKIGYWDLPELNKSKLIISDLVFHGIEINPLINKIYFTQDNLVIDSVYNDSYYNSNKLRFGSNTSNFILDSKINGIKLVLFNSDTINKKIELFKSSYSMIDFGLIKNPKYCGDVILNITDTLENLNIDSIYVFFPNYRIEKVKNGQTIIKNLFAGKRDVNIFNKDFLHTCKIKVEPQIINTIDETLGKNCDISSNSIKTLRFHNSVFITIIKNENGIPINSDIKINRNNYSDMCRRFHNLTNFNYNKTGKSNIYISQPGYIAVNDTLNFENENTLIKEYTLKNDYNMSYDSIIYYQHRGMLASMVSSSLGDDNPVSLNEVKDKQPDYILIDKLFLKAEEQFKKSDTLSAELTASSFLDIDEENSRQLYKSFVFYSKTGNRNMAFTSLDRCSDNYLDNKEILKAHFFEKNNQIDSALNIYNQITAKMSNEYYIYSNIISRKLKSKKSKTELPDDEKIDLLISSECDELTYGLNLQIIGPYGYYRHYYRGRESFWGCLDVDSPNQLSSYVIKQAVPGKYKIKAHFSTRYNNNEILKKYRGRIIIERNIGSANYEKKIIEVESENRWQDLEFEI